MIESLLDSPRLSRTRIPVIETSIPAGFPSPADDYTAARLDLNQKFLKNPTACFFARVTGRSMEGAGIFDGDYLLIDRSIEARHNDIVVAVIAGEFTVKRLFRRNGRCALVPENPEFPEIEISPEADDTWIWGVVTSVHRSVRG
ncbi:translesion error-prone DNA polymerase V autoproteolytic subunit [Aetokthonos hydrillicola CCALA 1050]|nr:translesion error-prone DNA polymerase V autoproteolytic subunit [Aetokthonos hydrillicola CCALA 1050]